MIRALTLCLAVFLLSSPAQRKSDVGSWDSWRFLLGEWTGEGGGQPGQGTGTFSFNFDLQGKVLVRRNHADYHVTKDRPASSHEDLMVIYQEEGPRTRGIYFDSEGHVIHYTAEFSEDKNTITFVSAPAPSDPRFRLTYTKGKNGTLAIKFEIAPPGKPDSFSTYLEGVARRQGPH
jgi:hypothetical protein